MLTNGIFEAADILDADMTQDIILQLGMNELPIYSYLVSRGAIRDTFSERPSWLVNTLPARRTKINNAPDNYDETTTSIVVDDASLFYVDATVLCEATGEVIAVSAVNTGTNTLTVIRGVGSTTAAAGSVADNADLQVIAHAAGEGSAGPALEQQAPTKISNRVQTIRKGVTMSGRADHTRQEGEDQRGSQRRRKFEEAARDIEKAMLFNAGGEQDVNGLRTTYMTGFYNFVNTNRDNIGGAMTRARFDQFAEMAFAVGSSVKLLVVGSKFNEVIHQHYHNNLRVMPRDARVGLKITEIDTPFGTFEVVHSRALKGGYTGDAVVIDPAQAEIRTMAPKDGRERGRLHLRTDIQAPGADAVQDEWMAELTIEYGDESAHAIAEGVTAAA